MGKIFLCFIFTFIFPQQELTLTFTRTPLLFGAKSHINTKLPNYNTSHHFRCTTPRTALSLCVFAFLYCQFTCSPETYKLVSKCEKK